MSRYVAFVAISLADASLKDIDQMRSDLGSTQNQVSSTISNISTTRANIRSAESNMREIDISDELSSFTRFQIFSRTGSFALAQANARSMNVLTLLEK
jgi:flagellin